MKSGIDKFLAKFVYKLLADSTCSTSGVLDEESWKFWLKFWKEKNALPRILIFIWRCLHRALPIKSNLKKKYT